MLAARDQENLVARHHNGAALKQQQNTRQLQPKTPGARYPKTPVKIPLNDENAGHIMGGAKSVLGGRSKGNENVMTTSKGVKGFDKSNFVTPMEPRARAVLGDKTTNAKAKGLQPINVKSAVQEIEKSQAKAPTTVRPKQRQAQVETQKLEVHAEETDPLSEEDVEYCPPKPTDLPYRSDVFPDGVLTFEGLKKENLFQGYYQYYFNPVDENGVSLADRQLAERNRKAMEECNRRVQQDMDEFDWSIGDVPESKDYFKKNKQPAPAADPTQRKIIGAPQAVRKPLSSITSRNAANVLAINDGTRSLQRNIVKSTSIDVPKKKTSFAIPGLRGIRSAPPPVARKSSMEIRAAEANSRSTIGYNKGRAAASVLAKGSTTKVAANPGQFKPKAAGLPRSETTLSSDSDRTITPARYAHGKVSAAIEDQQWKERVPFLSIFDPEEDDDDFDLVGSGLPKDLGGEDEEEFEMGLPE